METELVKQVYMYITTGRYRYYTESRKCVIRNKFKRFLVENGELHYIQNIFVFDVTFLTLFVYQSVYIYIHDNCCVRIIYSKKNIRF